MHLNVSCFLKERILVANRFSNGQPMNRLDRVLMQVRTLRTFAQAAENRILHINTVIQEVNAIGLLNPTVLLGQLLHQRGYEPVPGGSDSGQVIQAALLVPGGIGALYWDTETYQSLVQTPEGLEADSWRHFVPFDKCEVAIRAMLAVHHADLVNRFLQLFE
jgi:hypothetical protein